MLRRAMAEAAMRIEASEAELTAGRGYEALFVPAVFAAWTERLIEAAGLGAGDATLDVACGTGVLARRALEVVGKGGRVAGLDPAPGMLAVAQEQAPDVDWRLGPAEALPFEAASFDAALCQFGLMFFEDRPAALREMIRVLRPGGRVAAAVWAGPEANLAHAEVAGLLDDQAGREAGNAVRVPFALGDAEALASMFEDAGFEAVQVGVEQEEARFPSARVMVEADLRGWLPLFGIHLDEAKIAEVLAAAETRLEPFVAASGEAVFEMTALVIEARRPG